MQTLNQQFITPLERSPASAQPDEDDLEGIMAIERLKENLSRLKEALSSVA